MNLSKGEKMIIAKACVTMKGLVIQPYSWEREIKIDLIKISRCLKENGVRIKKIIPQMLLIAEIGGYEVSIYPSGKLIIKLLEDSKKGKEIAKEVLGCADLLDVLE